MNKTITAITSFVKKNKVAITMFSVMAVLLVMAPHASAELFNPTRDLPESIDVAGGGNTLRAIILLAINFILGFVGLIAVIMMIYGGFVLLTAAGDEDATGKAKNIILFAVIGIIIILFSFAIVNTLFDITTGADVQTATN